MFQVWLGSAHDSPFTLTIYKCPPSGLPAHDYRRQHGLPLAPNNKITLSPFHFDDEAFVREHRERTGQAGDILLWSHEAGRQRNYELTKDEPMWQITTGPDRELRTGELVADAEVILDYHADLSRRTARRLLTNLWEQDPRNWEFLRQEIAQHKARQERRRTQMEWALRLTEPERKAQQDKIESQAQQLLTLQAALDMQAAELRHMRQERAHQAQAAQAQFTPQGTINLHGVDYDLD